MKNMLSKFRRFCVDRFLQKELAAQRDALKAKETEIAELNRKLTENVLTRYLPPKVVQDVLRGKLEFDMKVKAETVTVLFADLCGFTAATERLGPKEISEILNQYLIGMTEIVFAHDGIVDKFVGDGIMALFGVPGKMYPESQADSAIKTALAMQEKVAFLNESWRAAGLPELRMRIGVHQGPVVVGHFGGTRRSDYTAIGMTVNIASRIECAGQPGDVLVSKTVSDFLARGQCAAAGSFELKGVTGEQPLYRVLGPSAKAA